MISSTGDGIPAREKKLITDGVNVHTSRGIIPYSALRYLLLLLLCEITTGRIHVKSDRLWSVHAHITVSFLGEIYCFWRILGDTYFTDLMEDILLIKCLVGWTEISKCLKIDKDEKLVRVSQIKVPNDLLK